MITIINEKDMTLENYDEILDIPREKIQYLIVEYKLSDNNVDIEFYTRQDDEAYQSDVI